MKTAILTGFRPFGPYVVNPTEVLAFELQDKELAGHEINSLVFSKRVFPHGYNYGQLLIDEALSSQASVIISLGMASEVQGLRIEQVATNWAENDAYCVPTENYRRLSTDRPAKEKLQMPLESWDLSGIEAKLLSTATPLTFSQDAGGYICNALMYRTLREMERRSVRIPFLFAHIPCTEEAIANIPSFERERKRIICQEDLVMAVEILLQSYS